MNPGEKKKRRRPRRKGAQNAEPQGNGPIRIVQLKDWAGLTQEPEVLLIHLMLHLDQLTDFFNSQSISSQEMEHLAVIFESLLVVKYHEHSFNHILELLASSRFYDVHLVGYLNGQEEPSGGKVAPIAIVFVEEISRRLPSRIHGCRSFVLCMCQKYASFNCELQAVNKMINSFNAAVERSSVKNSDASNSLEDFRELTVFPTEKDTEDGVSPFIRRNQVAGAFSDKRHYFDVVFRLLREDFFRPLRESIAHCRKGNTKFTDSAAIIYSNVRIVSVRLENGIEHVLLLDIARLRAINWDCTKYFKTGNLVCVSRNNFKTIMFGVVGFNTVRGVANGRVRVYFHNCFEAVYGIAADEKLKLIESPSFFVAYRYVLEGLQDMFDLHLPMEPYLVQCVPESKQTSYLTDTTCYDLSSIKGDDFTHVKWTPQKVIPTDSWPRLTKVCLNEEQYAAVKVALTQELTLLQGPPGTGKTYVSWKLMRILLENRGRGVPDDRPILVVCFTNHALDQFLEGLLPFCEKGIVRVGGRSNSRALEPFNLREISRRKRSNLLSRYTKTVRRKITSIERDLRTLTQNMKMFQAEIPDIDDLKDFMTEFHLRNLLSGVPSDTAQSMLLRTWLNMAKDNLGSSLVNRIEAHLIACLMEEKNRRKDSCLDFSADIPFSLKAAVYRNWAYKFENTSWELCIDKILPDDKLKSHISQKVLTAIYDMGFESIKDWLLGRDAEEMLDNVEELQEELFENNVEEVNNDDDQEYYDSWDDDDDDDDDDSECTEDSGEEHPDSASSAVHIISRAKMLGVDFSSENVQENLTMELSSGQIMKKLQVAKPMTGEEESKVVDVWKLSSNNRFRLYKSWFERLMTSISRKIQELTDNYNLLLEQKREIREMKDLAVLKNAMVVGMTTTGAARNRKLLRTIGPRIIVVEEAAEVLEAHIITALNEHCQHLILIGDHQQLRPRTQVYQLAQEFGLEVSMFERLVNNKFTCIQLVEQHRMRPEISVFMRLIYPDLKDSESVKGRPSVSGMDKNVFFIKHNQPENNVKNGASKLNNFEARYLIKLCEYLIMQGYGANDITILGAYSGQVTLIQELITNSKKPWLQTVHVSTVDSFQGEQNKIILLSLVRSNVKERVGFLSTDNRVCVALSRAQFGMYVIGDIDLLVRHSDLWRRISETAERQECIGSVLRLRCQNQKHVTDIGGLVDFEKVIHARGCFQICKDRLSCGHLCLKTCHVGGHQALECDQACLKSCPNGHTCTGTCGEECPPCFALTTKTLTCGHLVQTKCGYQYDIACTQPCLKKCPSGHACGLKCNEPCQPCKKACKFRLPCGHLCSKQCHVSGHSNIICNQPCLKTCPSGHSCGLKCSEPCKPCKKACKIRLPCGHLCSKQCHLDGHYNIVCNQPCLKTCPSGHSCGLKCSEPCQPCKKACKFPLPCGHLCSKRCHLDGHDNIVCNQPCLKQCLNEHKCPGKCSEECPPCGQLISKSLTCGHFVETKCGFKLYHLVCTQPCLKKCPSGHPCPLKCYDRCQPCTLQVKRTLSCGHEVVTACNMKSLACHLRC
ncbi:unnamed protein product, partial [Lymnaea stagnalis]